MTAKTAQDREKQRHYISATEDDIREMMAEIGVSNPVDVFSHIPVGYRFSESPDIGEELDYEETRNYIKSIAARNRIPKHNFIADGLPFFQVPKIVPYVLGLRGLATAYTPYQPERSQGTLLAHWIYQCAMCALTGFDAVNASMYDRSTALFEALQAAVRISNGKKNTVIVCETVYPRDLEVLITLAKHTALEIRIAPMDSDTGRVDLDALMLLGREVGSDLAALAFPQVNAFGILEDVDALTDAARQLDTRSVAVIEPTLLGAGGLKPPIDFGDEGADIFVAEGQSLSCEPNFGGPGLGIFGMRMDNNHRNDIRSSPGRFVGNAKDLNERDCKVLVIAAREQHIRREKATSNICSNEAFIATLTGAALLERGDAGLKKMADVSRKAAQLACSKLTALPGVRLKFSDSAFFNEFTLQLDRPVQELIDKAAEQGLHIGVNVSGRCGAEGNLLLTAFTDRTTEESLSALIGFFQSEFGVAEKQSSVPEVPIGMIRIKEPGIPAWSREELKDYYQSLSDLNVSPDNALYPLGSCTMKYNPRLNEELAALPEFTDVHPEAPEQDTQGCLEIIYETQELFKLILGMAGVTTQPVAGAQGELVGLKLFQAYHAERNDCRDIVLIPHSAHGTNPATASFAGYVTKNRKGEVGGVVEIEADETGRMNLTHLEKLLKEYGPRVAGIMVTNPNTSGVFEDEMKTVADMIHAVGGLVYMDGANMNAIAGWVNLGRMGVDAVHNNTHKTWSIPHGGGGPGDALVGVSEKLLPYLPGIQVKKQGERYVTERAEKSFGSVHRHYGNFAHKIRCLSYLKRLGRDGLRAMSFNAVLASRYLYSKICSLYPSLPAGAVAVPRMHEFIITLPKEIFKAAEKAGVARAEVISRVGKLFLDFGYHAPTVAFPEVFGIMIEPTESFTKSELDRFVEAVLRIYRLIEEEPAVLKTAPHFTPIRRVEETAASRNLKLCESLKELPILPQNPVPPSRLLESSPDELAGKILKAHRELQGSA